MPNTTQAQADSTDQPTVADPLDTANTQNNGTSELADYADEVAQMLANDSIDMTDELTEHQATDFESDEVDESTEADGEETNEDSLEDDADDADEEVKTSMRPRLRDPVDIAVAAIAKARGVNLIEAARLYEQGTPTAASTENQGEQSTPSETVATVNAEIENLRQLRKEATAEMEFDTMNDLNDQIDALREKRDELRVSESKAKAETENAAQQSFDADYRKSMKNAVTFYPDSKSAETPLTKRMIELDNQMLELGDPLYHSPDKPFLLAKAAARDLGVLMTKTAPVAAKAATRSAMSPFQPAPGNRGTTTTTATQKFESEVDAITDLGEYERKFGRG